MNIYNTKLRWKFFLLIGAIIIGILSTYYTQYLVGKLSAEERRKVELWAAATRQLSDTLQVDHNLNFLLEVIENNKTIPVIWVDENDSILSYVNIDESRAQNKTYLWKRLEKMKEEHEPIDIAITDENITQHIYFDDSLLLIQLFYYPFVQLGIILLFVMMAYFAFSTSRKAEQNQVWVGLSKETAHQLGTPTSSLMAFLEILKQENLDPDLVHELEKDIQRLEKITQRFSKIGSLPSIQKHDIYPVLNETVKYLRSRISGRIRFQTDVNPNEILPVPMNPSLFEWVIENLCKNAADAMGGKGTLSIRVQPHKHHIFVDVMDTGRGLPKSRFKTVFKPGYTTKPRGWGLGLSLTKRIIEEYHKGKIFVNYSDPDKGTCFRIVLKRDL